MQPTNALMSQPLPETPGMGRLSSLDDATHVVVSGALLEAQYRCDSGYLVLTTQNSPFDETLDMLLLDDRLQRLDAIELRQVFTGAILKDRERLDRDRLRFTFFGDDRWELRLRSRPGLGGPRLPHVARRGLPFWRPCHLELQLLVPPQGDTP